MSYEDAYKCLMRMVKVSHEDAYKSLMRMVISVSRGCL